MVRSSSTLSEVWMLALSIACLVSCSAAVTAQQLKLKTTVVSQYYCPGDDDLDGLTLGLKYTYTNAGNETFILAKDSSEFSQMIVSKNENGSVGAREMNPVFTWIPSGESKAKPNDLNRYFVILKPNQSYSHRSVARVFVFREGRSGIAGAVRDGRHFLQLRVATWPGSGELYQELKAAWKEHGTLWGDSVLSEPMPFTVVPKRRLIKCR